MEKNIEFTTFSENEWKNIVNKEMTPSDVSAYFYEGIKMRKFKDILEYFAEGKDIKSLLIDSFCEFDKSAKRDSVRKKVSNWLNDENEPSDRNEHIKICFALRLDEIWHYP